MLILPFLVNLIFLMVLDDSDNFVFYLVKYGLIPVLLIVFSSSRISRRAIPCKLLPRKGRVSDPLVASHFNRSAEVYVDHALEVYRTSAVQRLDLMERSLNLPAEDEVTLLDLGCGGGAFLDMFLDRFATGRATGNRYLAADAEQEHPQRAQDPDGGRCAGAADGDR